MFILLFHTHFHVSPPHQPPRLSKLRKKVNLIYRYSTSLIVLLSVNPALDECSNTVSDDEVVDIPVPPAPRKQSARMSGKCYQVDSTVNSTHQLQGPDPIVDGGASDDNWGDDAEQSSVTEPDDDDDDVVVVESDDLFFNDPKNNNNKLLQKLKDEVCVFPLPLSTQP